MTSLPPGHSNRGVSRLELIMMAAGFLGLWVFLAIYAGGPIYSDELLYMDAGLNNLRIPFILNRYTHVFLQKIFLELAPSPLAGANIYWAFLISATGFLVYWNARTLHPGSNTLHAMLAALIFFSFRFISDFSGVTIVDFTTMLAVMLFITIYLSAARADFKSLWRLAALGFVFFLGFKSKETMLPFGFMLIGLAFPPGSSFSLRQLWKNLKPWLIGVSGGVVLFILLNGTLLGDPFFGFSPASLREFSSSYIDLSLTSFEPPTQDWYTNLIAGLWLVPFLLYLVSGMAAARDDQLPPAQRLVWGSPVVLLLFLIAMMARNFYEPSPRYFFPALAVISFLAPQFLRFSLPSKHFSRYRWWVVASASLAFTFYLTYVLRSTASRIGWEFDGFLNIIIIPGLLTFLLGLALFVRRYSHWSVLLPGSLIALIMFYPLRMNIKYLVVLHPNRDIVQERFYPFFAFAEHLHFSPDMSLYVSSDIPASLDMLSADRADLVAMYNVYFDAGAVKSNIDISAPPQPILADLQQGQYDLVILTDQDWRSITSNPAGLAWIEQNYVFVEDEAEPLFLLQRR